MFFGNQYRLGEAILEVSKIREPCWKIQTKYGIKDLVKRMSTSGKTGFYFRVLQEGYVDQDDDLELIQLADEATRLSVQELNDIYYNDRKNVSRLKYALQNPYLFEMRLAKLQKLYDNAKFYKHNIKRINRTDDLPALMFYFIFLIYDKLF